MLSHLLCFSLNPVSDYLSLLLLPLVSPAFRLLFTTPAPSLCLEMDARYWRCVKLINCRSLEALLQSVVQITNTVGNWGLAVFHPNFNEWLTGALYFRTCDITEDPSENPQCNIRHNLMCIFLVMNYMLHWSILKLLRLAYCIPPMHFFFFAPVFEFISKRIIIVSL